MALALSLLAQAASAELTIRITKGVEGALPIAVLPFQGPGGDVPDLGQIIAADLARSGRFRVLETHRMPQSPTSAEEIQFPLWQSSGVESLVMGSVSQTAEGAYEAAFQLYDVLQGNSMIAFSFKAETAQLRRVAHHMADLIYKQLLGEPGAFNTRIAYVQVTNEGEERIHTLVVADADGYDPQVVLRSPYPVMSPAWSPDGEQLAYVSFESQRPQIFIQEVFTGQRRVVASFPGINGAPGFSPDGKRLALTLSQDGDPEIYVLDLDTQALKRLTRNVAIDTEPVWMPDGRRLLFTSDRSGGPQIYEVDVESLGVKRVSFEGNYNARASVSADGQNIAMVHGYQGQYRIAVLNRETRVLRMLSGGRLDESPSFAPNGSMILYATQGPERGVLAAVSVDGGVQQLLELASGDIREPAWSPFSRGGF